MQIYALEATEGTSRSLEYFEANPIKAKSTWSAENNWQKMQEKWSSDYMLEKEFQ